MVVKRPPPQARPALVLWGKLRTRHRVFTSTVGEHFDGGQDSVRLGYRGRMASQRFENVFVGWPLSPLVRELSVEKMEWSYSPYRRSGWIKRPCLHATWVPTKGPRMRSPSLRRLQVLMQKRMSIVVNGQALGALRVMPALATSFPEARTIQGVDGLLGHADEVESPQRLEN